MMTLIHVLILAYSFAGGPVPSIVKDTAKRLPANRRVIYECLVGRPSPDKSISCVDAYQYVNDYCAITREPWFKLPSMQNRTLRLGMTNPFDEVCRLAGMVEGQADEFFDLDTKGCFPGHATAQDRLVSMRKYIKLFEEDYSAQYLKNSCHEYRSYVNLCAYVDGDLRTAMPKRFEFLPPLDFSREAASLCRPDERTGGTGIYRMTHDLARLAQNPQNKAYETLIAAYRRARGPASQNEICEQVRTGYMNVGCERYEPLQAGDPVLFSNEEFRQRRIQQNDRNRDTAK